MTNFIDAEELKEVFDYTSPYDMYRCAYKCTPCGPSIGMEIDGKMLYCDELPDKWSGIITMISVGSIVEGVDYDCETIEIWFTEDKTLEDIAKEYYEALENVNNEANDIWMQTHGCDGCSKLHGITLDNSENGYIPVHPDCKECEGYGIVI